MIVRVPCLLSNIMVEVCSEIRNFFGGLFLLSPSEFAVRPKILAKYRISECPYYL